MILAVDVSYRQQQALAAGVRFHAWEAREPAETLTLPYDVVAPYVPGQFYKRELPPILALLNKLARLPDTIIVDGYVYLGKQRHPGLGKYLYDALDGQAVVVGVAKSRFRGTSAETKVFRAGSRRPLYVTAVGMDANEAQHLVAGMCGAHRMPTLLRLVDRLSKTSAISN